MRLDKNVVVFDLETTGTSVTKDRIVSISALKIDNFFNQVEPIRKVLINPMMPIPADATAVHGITDEMVKDQPTFRAFAKSMFAFFLDCDLCGFNAINFDVPLLAEEFLRADMNWPSGPVNILDPFKIFVIREKRDLSAALKFYTGETMEGAHDATNDVMATVKILAGQCEKYPDLGGMNNSEFAAICMDGMEACDLAGKIVIGKEGHPVYAFGKDEGKRLDQNPGFAKWMLGQDFPTQTKNIIKNILKIR